MNITNTIPVRAAIVAAICFAVAACGTEQGTRRDGDSHHATQHAATDDVAAQIDYRKAALSQRMSRPQQAVADDMVARIEYRKAALSQGMGRPQDAVADDVARRVEERKSAHGTR